jgi:hypothetical protein
MEVECSLEWKPDAIIDLALKVTYEGVADEDGARPITFHTEPFVTGEGRREGIRLYRHRAGKWERSSPDDGFGTDFGIFDDPPIPVNVGEDGKYRDRFVSLRPGESWTTQVVFNRGQAGQAFQTM